MLQSPSSQKQQITLSLPKPLIERLRNAVYWTGDRPLVGLVAEAIEDIVTQMEEVNGGPFPNVYPLSSEGNDKERTLRSTPLRPILPILHVQTDNLRESPDG